MIEWDYHIVHDEAESPISVLKTDPFILPIEAVVFLGLAYLF